VTSGVLHGSSSALDGHTGARRSVHAITRGDGAYGNRQYCFANVTIMRHKLLRKYLQSCSQPWRWRPGMLLNSLPITTAVGGCPQETNETTKTRRTEAQPGHSLQTSRHRSCLQPRPRGAVPVREAGPDNARVRWSSSACYQGSDKMHRMSPHVHRAPHCLDPPQILNCCAPEYDSAPGERDVPRRGARRVRQPTCVTVPTSSP
jgi:hypothetical protein